MQNMKVRSGVLLTLLIGLGPVAGPGRASGQVLSGSIAGDRFGQALAWAGDVNGDGRADLLIGSPGARGAAGIAGTVSLYLGLGDRMPEVASLVLEGEVGGDAFGAAVSTAGDVNGDGFDDFLVGAPGHDAAGVSAGRVYLFLGGPTPGSAPARTWDGGLPGAALGAALAGGFDFNGDGRSDFATGAPESNAGGTRTGHVDIYLGNADPASIASPGNFRFDGDLANWYLGHSLDSAGDVNQDGLDDLVAGAPQLFDANPGRAVVWLGQASTATSPSRIVLSGETASDRFGFSVSGAGDRNQDGYDDVLVGAPGYDFQGFNKGAAYLFYGGAAPNTGFDWRTVGIVAGDSLGYAVDGGFDLDGDSLPEIAVGAPGADFPAAGAGEVRLFSGRTHPSGTAGRVLTPTAPQPGFEAGDRAGAAVRFVGSLDGDLVDDLAVGAPHGSLASGIHAGYVGLVAGGPDATPVRLLSLAASRSGSAAEIRWELMEAGELSGLRVRAARGLGTWEPLHPGWLDASIRSIRDAAPGDGRVTYRLEGLDRAGELLVLGTRVLSPLVGLPLALRAARNPFRSELPLVVSLPEGSSRIEVLDAAGRRVRILWEGAGPGGVREISWDGFDGEGRSMPPGVYFVAAGGAGAVRVAKVVRLP